MPQCGVLMVYISHTVDVELNGVILLSLYARHRRTTVEGRHLPRGGRVFVLKEGSTTDLPPFPPEVNAFHVMVSSAAVRRPSLIQPPAHVPYTRPRIYTMHWLKELHADDAAGFQ